MNVSLKPGTSAVLKQARNQAGQLSSRIQGRLPKSVQRHLLLTAILFAAILSTAIAALFWFGGNDSTLRPLYGRQEMYNTAAIIELLDSEQIPYQLHPDTGQILVSADQLSLTRMRLATAGITPRMPEGMKLLSGSGQLGRSQFIERKQYIQALQGELERTIISFRPIRFARVHLAIPERLAFQREQGETSASVYLDLYPGASLDSKQVQGIINLVAGSVPNLKPERVSVLDQNSNPLYGLTADTLDGSKELTYRRKLEQQYVSQLTYLLEPLVGAGNLRVAVNADIDFSYQESTYDNYDPKSAAVRSESYSQQATGETTAASGVPGASTSQPATSPDQDSPDGTIKRIRNFELDRTVRFKRQDAFRLNQINVAVLLNSAIPVLEGKDDTAFIEAVNSLLRNAAGINMDRGDRVEVRLLPFSIVSMEEQEMAEAMSRKSSGSYGLWLALLILVVTLIGLGIFFAKRMKKENHAQSTIEKELALLDDLANGKADGGAEHDKASDRVRDLVDSNPGQVATILERWMKEAD